jgi:hypothetical protein
MEQNPSLEAASRLDGQQDIYVYGIRRFITVFTISRHWILS